jgi:hypothetical protein
MVVCWPVPHTEYSCIEYYLHATIVVSLVEVHAVMYTSIVGTAALGF